MLTRNISLLTTVLDKGVFSSTQYQLLGSKHLVGTSLPVPCCGSWSHFLAEATSRSVGASVWCAPRVSLLTELDRFPLPGRTQESEREHAELTPASLFVSLGFRHLRLCKCIQSARCNISLPF